jgi:hypothetical protein
MPRAGGLPTETRLTRYVRSVHVRLGGGCRNRECLAPWAIARRNPAMAAVPTRDVLHYFLALVKPQRHATDSTRRTRLLPAAASSLGVNCARSKVAQLDQQIAHGLVCCYVVLWLASSVHFIPGKAKSEPLWGTHAAAQRRPRLRANCRPRPVRALLLPLVLAGSGASDVVVRLGLHR